MIPQWKHWKRLILVVLATLPNYSSSYLHESSYNLLPFTIEGVLPPLSPVAKSKSDKRYEDRQSKYCTSIPVVYTNDPESVAMWLSANAPDGQIGIIGFDTESLPRYYRRYRKKNPFEYAATVQLATSTSCLVVHLVGDKPGAYSSDCSEVLKGIIDDPRYIKAGCAIDEDLLDLHNLWGGLDAKSRLDLGAMGCDQSDRVGLRAMAARTLDVDLPKTKRITLSDWTKVPLTKRQIIYSARDAWAGAAIAEELAKNDPTLFSPESLVESLRIELPIAELAERKQKRDEAKQELGKLLRPYKRRNHRHLPKHIRKEATRLRRIIKNRVVESTCLLDGDIDGDIDGDHIDN